MANIEAGSGISVILCRKFNAKKVGRERELNEERCNWPTFSPEARIAVNGKGYKQMKHPQTVDRPLFPDKGIDHI